MLSGDRRRFGGEAFTSSVVPAKALAFKALVAFARFELYPVIGYSINVRRISYAE